MKKEKEYNQTEMIQTFGITRRLVKMFMPEPCRVVYGPYTHLYKLSRIKNTLSSDDFVEE